MDRIPAPVARGWARSILADVLPLVERAEVVGSLRRGAEEVGDLELLVEPTMERVDQADMFSAGRVEPNTQAVIDAVLEADDGRSVVKAGTRYAQVNLAGSRRPREATAKLDLFFCHPPASWGALMVIRTGPAELSRAMVSRLRSKGWKNEQGAVWRRDGRRWVRHPTPTEEDYFEACDLEYKEPERRDELARALREQVKS